MKLILKSNKAAMLMTSIVVVIMVLLVTTAFIRKEAVASVDGEAISKDELYDELVAQYGTAALETLISNKLVELEAKKQNIKVKTEEVEEELALLMDSYGGEEMFNMTINQSGLSLESVKENLERYLLTKKLLEPRIEITEKELKNYFEENKATFAEEEQVNASHILVEDEATAQEVSEKLAAGESFADLAKEYSTDTGTAENGGELGFFSKGDMVAEFEEVAFSLEINKISAPVKTEYGYHIIKTLDKKEAKDAVFEEHQLEINDIIFDEKLQTEYNAWLEELKQEYEIKNFIDEN